MQLLDNLLKKKFTAVSVLAVFTLLMLHGPQHFTDTETYTDASLSRSPLYPFVIDVFRFLCGNSFEYWLVAFQLILGGWAIHTFCGVVSRQFSLPPWGFLVTLALAASPYFGLSIQTGNAILGEGLAYPLFLFAICFLIKGLVEVSFRSIVIFVLFSVLLVLIRKQFLFLYPITLLLIGYFFFKGGGQAKTLYLLVILMVGGFSASFIEYANNYLRHGHFVPISHSTSLLLTMAVYVSKSTDTLAISDEQQAKLFREIYSDVNQKKIILDTLDTGQNLYMNKFQHFYTNYPAIMTSISHAADKIYLGKSSTENEGRISAAKEMTRLTLTLIQENPQRYAMMYLLNISYGLGGHGIGDGYGIRGNYFALLQLVAVLLLCAYSVQCQQKKPVAIVMFSLLLLHLANIAQVALALPAFDRYTFYTSTVLMVYLAALVSKGIESLVMPKS